MKIYVGNLSYDTTDDDLREAFEKFGTVESAVVVTDKIEGRSKGFGFVEMSSESEAKEAINGMNGQELHGRPLKVNESKPRPEGERGYRGSGRGGFGGGNRGGFGGGNRGGHNINRPGRGGDR